VAHAQWKKGIAIVLQRSSAVAVQQSDYLENGKINEQQRQQPTQRKEEID